MRTTAIATTPDAGMLTVAVIGLGYVGLPLVVEFGKLTRTIGFDIVDAKVATCRAGSDDQSHISPARQRSFNPRCRAGSDTVEL